MPAARIALDHAKKQAAKAQKLLTEAQAHYDRVMNELLEEAVNIAEIKDKTNEDN